MSTPSTRSTPLLVADTLSAQSLSSLNPTQLVVIIDSLRSLRQDDAEQLALRDPKYHEQLMEALRENHKLGLELKRLRNENKLAAQNKQLQEDLQTIKKEVSSISLALSKIEETIKRVGDH
jgi:hypothetical protein